MIQNVALHSKTLGFKSWSGQSQHFLYTTVQSVFRKGKYCSVGVAVCLFQHPRCGRGQVIVQILGTLFSFQGKEKAREFRWTNKAPPGYQIWKPLVPTDRQYNLTKWGKIHETTMFGKTSIDLELHLQMQMVFTNPIELVTCADFFEPPEQYSMYVGRDTHLSHKCVVLVMLQIEFAHWMPVPCQKPLTKMVACEKVKHAPEGQKIHSQGCPHHHVIFDNYCVQIFRSPSPTNTTVSQYILKHFFPEEVSSFLWQVKLSEVNGSETRKVGFPQNIFECKSGAFVNTISLLDGKHSCGENDTSDEHFSHSNVTEWLAGLNLISSCPQNMFKGKDTKCYSFVEERVTKPKQTDIKLKNISCKSYSQESYYFFNHCFYTHNKEGHLMFCSNGEHLQNCHYFQKRKYDFQCSGKYKCPSSYCISFVNVCDGKWDCPHGEDEQQCHLLDCSRKLKCKLSNRCAHLLDTCDGFKDCILGDDEAMCDLPHGIRIPTTCFGLNYGITCYNCSSVVSFFEQLKDSIPYVCVAIINSLDAAPIRLLSLLFRKTILEFPGNNITHICVFKHSNKGIQFVLYLNLFWNNISVLHENCFGKMSTLLTLILVRNRISTIKMHSFLHLSALTCLNLANNKLTEIGPHTFHGTKALTFLNVSQEHKFSLTHWSAFSDSNSNIFVVTADYHLCCVAHQMCSAAPAWPGACHRMFYTATIAILSWVCTIIAILLCTCCIFGSQFTVQDKKTENKQGSGYHVITNIMYITVLCYAITNIFLLVCDTVFDIHFIGAKFAARGNAFCTVIGPAKLLLETTTILSIIILVISRYSVTVYPLSSPFREIEFVHKIRLRTVIIISCSVFSFSFAYSYQPEFHLLSMPLCFMHLNFRHTHTNLVMSGCYAGLSVVACFLITTFSALMIMSFDDAEFTENNILQTRKRKQRKAMIKNTCVSITVNISSLLTLAVTMLVFIFLKNIHSALWVSVVVIPMCFILNILILNFKNCCRLICASCVK